MKQKSKTAEELHENVPPDWYYQSIKRNLLQRIWHKSRFYVVGNLTEPTKGRVLDIGSADGMFTKVILDKSGAEEIIGIDVLASSVIWANKHWKKDKRMKFMVADAHKLPFESQTFNAVFALEVLEHVFEPEKILKEIKRVLKPHGYAIFLVPSDNLLFLSIWLFVKKFWWARIWEGTHVQSYKNHALAKLCEKVGFEIEVDKHFWLGMLNVVKVRKI